jgi:16S rRNA (uracil1498-N3)-methyltransferase
MAKIHRFIDTFDLNKKELEITGEIANQIIKVLKLKIGEKIELCDGKQISAIAEICKIDKKSVWVKIFKKDIIQKSGKEVNLFCAILKKENFELVVQKTTECGVSKIIPIITSRTVKTGLNLERLKKIAKEASEQSGRNDIPEILEPINFEESLKLINQKNSNILFNADGENFNSLDNFQLSTFNLFIGPEGGWTPEEIQKAKSLNFKIASLGPFTLRAETAAIVATYLTTH